MTAVYSLSSLSLALWQSDPSSEHWLTIFVGVIALVMLGQGLIILVAGMKGLKILNEVQRLATELHGKAAPLMDKTTVIIDDLSPKIRTVSENVTQMSYTVREKVDQVGKTVSEVNRTVTEANQKTRGQVQHVDRMVSTALDATEDMAHTVAHGIRLPVKQVAGIITGLRVGIETLVKNFTPKNNGNGPGPRGPYDSAL